MVNGKDEDTRSFAMHLSVEDQNLVMNSML